MVVVHVEAAQSDGRLGAWESEESLGDRLPVHVHTREDEQVVLLEGKITFWVGDRVHHLVSGDTLALPRGVPHAHLVTSRKARILTVAIPAASSGSSRTAAVRGQHRDAPSRSCSSSVLAVCRGSSCVARASVDRRVGRLVLDDARPYL
jgi:hypothetical protein